MNHFLMTIDVEEQSIVLNRLDKNIPNQLLSVGMPRLLYILQKHRVSATFYFTGTIAETHPQLIKMVIEKGHEAGCHGYDHSLNHAFDTLSYDKQVLDVQKAVDAMKACGCNPVSFRAPAARMGNKTIGILESFTFTSDSSVSSQRFDGPMTFGSKKKIKWLFTPRGPYFPARDNVFVRGNSNILEIPISAYIFPYIGTTMRASPRIFKFIERRLALEASRTNRPMVFLFHPNECLDNIGPVERFKRTESAIEHAFAGVLRQNIKLKNMGEDAITLLDQTLGRVKSRGFTFMRINEFTQQFGKKYKEICDNAG